MLHSAIPHEYAFPVGGELRLVTAGNPSRSGIGIGRGLIPLLNRIGVERSPESEGQAARRGNLAAQDCCHCAAAFLSGIPVQDDGFYLVFPRFQVEFSAGIHNYNHLVRICRDTLQQSQLASVQFVGPVMVFLFGLAVEAQRNYYCGSLFQYFRLRRPKHFDIPVFPQSPEPVHQCHGLSVFRIHPARTAAADDFIGIGAHHHNLVFTAAFKRQNSILVFQQHRAFQCDFIGAPLRQGRVFGSRVRFHRPVKETESGESRENVDALFVQSVFRNHPVLKQLLNETGLDHRPAGHLQIHPGGQEIQCAVGGIPVAHHNAFMPPGAEVVADKPWILRCPLTGL